MKASVVVPARDEEQLIGPTVGAIAAALDGAGRDYEILGIRALFRHGYDDTTNAFKAYRRHVIASVQPLVSHDFNLTVELPLKAVTRGSSYGIVPIRWTNRTSGESKLGLREMGSRYLYIVIMVYLEHRLAVMER